MTENIASRPAGDISGFHAHIYFDAATREPAKALRAAIEAEFPDIEMGRWWEKEIGPHPRWSYQTAFEPGLFGVYVPWLALNRRGLTVFIHPETGDDLADHRDHAIWMGDMPDLKLEMFEAKT